MTAPIPSAFSFLPTQCAQTIQQKLGDEVGKLASGLSIDHDQKIWNVQLIQVDQKAAIRAHTSDILHGATFFESESGILTHDYFEIKGANPSNFTPKIIEFKDNFPDNRLSYAIKILRDGNLVENQPRPEITKEMHECALRCFEQIGAPSSILPLMKSRVAQDSHSGKVVESKIEKFKWVFFSLALLAAVCFAYQMTKGHFAFFKPKGPKAA